jgi:hypothetical protein
LSQNLLTTPKSKPRSNPSPFLPPAPPCQAKEAVELEEILRRRAEEEALAKRRSTWAKESVRLLTTPNALSPKHRGGKHPPTVRGWAA